MPDQKKKKKKQKQNKTTTKIPTTTQFRDITKFLNTAQMVIYSRAKLTVLYPSIENFKSKNNKVFYWRIQSVRLKVYSLFTCNIKDFQICRTQNKINPACHF